MARERKVVQRWQCPICHSTYESPMRATEVLCKNNHVNPKGRGRSGRAVMQLIWPTPDLTKEAPNGNRSARRSTRR